MRERDIFRRYGVRGITEYQLSDGTALISDDTQMTLFTANGLLSGMTRGMTRGIGGPGPSYISLCYKDWLQTQEKCYSPDIGARYAWLANILNSTVPGPRGIPVLLPCGPGKQEQQRSQSTTARGAAASCVLLRSG